MRRIPLTRGKFALVDDADFDFLNQWKWRVEGSQSRTTFYAVRSLPTFEDGARKAVKLHQVLAAALGFSCPDHKDGNGLNNQKHNLRPAFGPQNQWNTRRRKDNSSGFKGVSWNKKNQKWVAYINKNRIRQHLGYFIHSESAARAYDKAAKELFGEFARLNFPD